MRLARNRRRRVSGDQPVVIGLPALVGRPRGKREPVSILDAPEDFIVRRYMRWRLGSRASAPGLDELTSIQVTAEFLAIMVKSVGTTVCFVLAGLLADWLATSERVAGGTSLAVAAVGAVVAIGVPAACLLTRRHAPRAPGVRGQPAARRRWPGWLLAVDGLATVAAGIAFGSIALGKAGPAGLPPLPVVWLAPLAYTTIGVGALAVWLLPVPAVPYLARGLRIMWGRIRLRVVGPGVGRSLPVRLRSVGSGRRDTWHAGVLTLVSGTLTWLGGDGTEVDLTDSSVVTDSDSALARTRTRATTRGPIARVAGPAGRFELEMRPRLFKSYQAAASDSQDEVLPG